MTKLIGAQEFAKLEQARRDLHQLVSLTEKRRLELQTVTETTEREKTARLALVAALDAQIAQLKKINDIEHEKASQLVKMVETTITAKKWLDHVEGFLLGVVSSLVATLVWEWARRRRRRQAEAAEELAG